MPAAPGWRPANLRIDFAVALGYTRKNTFLGDEELHKTRFEQQLSFLIEVDKMKIVLRQTLLADGSRQETDAEHSWHFALMSMVLYEYCTEPHVDLNQVIKMALVHDLVEIYAGDTFAYDIQGNQDKALREKLESANHREKFRLRFYNGDLSLLLLEKKTKTNGLCGKTQAALTVEEARALLEGRHQELGSSSPLLGELCRKMDSQGLRPKTIVEYTRELFLYGPGNVWVTLDYHKRRGLGPVPDGGGRGRILPPAQLRQQLWGAV